MPLSRKVTPFSDLPEPASTRQLDRRGQKVTVNSRHLLAAPHERCRDQYKIVHLSVPQRLYKPFHAIMNRGEGCPPHRLAIL
jgi:hypothetical protein